MMEDGTVWLGIPTVRIWSAETSAQFTRWLATLTKTKAKTSVHRGSQESKKEFKSRKHILESLHKPGIVLLAPTN